MISLIDGTIRSCVMNMHVYSKVRFDNAKDTNELIEAANQSSDLLVEAVKYKLSHQVELLVADKIQSSLIGTKSAVIRIGDKYYSVKEEK